MSFLAALKRETTDCHERLEKSLDLLHRVKSTDNYRALLTRFFTIYEPLEDGLGRAANWSAVDWEFSARLKTPWLREDLRALGVDDQELAAWTRCDLRSIEDGYGAAVGSLYVLEGSTLGGQLLSRQFQETLGVTPEKGGQFFRGYGELTVPRWRAFGTWAEAQAQAQAADRSWENGAVRGARNTFDAFSRWLT